MSSEFISDMIVNKLNYAKKRHTTSKIHKVVSRDTTAQHALVQTDKHKTPQKTRKQLLSEADFAFNKNNYMSHPEILRNPFTI